MYNPDKKLKATKKASHTVKVVLIEDGKSATVIQHIVGIQTGNHELVTNHSLRFSHVSEGEDSLYDSRWDDMVEDEGHEGTTVLARRRVNFITSLRLLNGEWCSDQLALSMLALEFFRDLFTSVNNDE
ncbi:hypothetical protein V6N12_029843 [Hibiscus sabdariffa]|uniref:Uncharacterized protein n=1 Tax=Hibiscus sabdariffa TaxID=183260 RepID=A0ABR2CXA6_9ROSI